MAEHQPSLDQKLITLINSCTDVQLRVFIECLTIVNEQTPNEITELVTALRSVTNRAQQEINFLQQNESIKKLTTFINSCSEKRLNNFFKQMGNNGGNRPRDEIDELVEALKSVTQNPHLAQLPSDTGSSSEIRTFSFTFQPVERLRDAIRALCYNGNVLGAEVALIEVGLQSSVCFEITVLDGIVGGSMGCLHLKACHMRNFQCKQPFERKFLSLYEIYNILYNSATVNDAVTIYHVEGSQELSFEFGTANDVGPHIVGFQPDKPQIFRTHKKGYVCSAVLCTDWLKDALPLMNIPMAEVEMGISDSLVTTKIGPYLLEWPNLKIPGSPRPSHEISFNWTSCFALCSACSLARLFKVYFTSHPIVLFKFKVHQLGHILFAKGAKSTNQN